MDFPTQKLFLDFKIEEFGCHYCGLIMSPHKNKSLKVLSNPLLTVDLKHQIVSDMSKIFIACDITNNTYWFSGPKVLFHYLDGPGPCGGGGACGVRTCPPSCDHSVVIVTVYLGKEVICGHHRYCLMFFFWGRRLYFHGTVIVYLREGCYMIRNRYCLSEEGG